MIDYRLLIRAEDLRNCVSPATVLRKAFFLECGKNSSCGGFCRGLEPSCDADVSAFIPPVAQPPTPTAKKAELRKRKRAKRWDEVQLIEMGCAGEKCENVE